MGRTRSILVGLCVACAESTEEEAETGAAGSCRAVIYLDTNPDGERCYDHAACCPDGFEFVGTDAWGNTVCLEE